MDWKDLACCFLSLGDEGILLATWSREASLEPPHQKGQYECGLATLNTLPDAMWMTTEACTAELSVEWLPLGPVLSPIGDNQQNKP
jgi:hypothetical protein